MNKIEKALQLVQLAKVLVADAINLANNGSDIGIPVSQLAAVKSRLDEIEANILAEALPEKSLRKPGMGRMITDSWPLGSSLGAQILAAEQAYLSL